MPSLRNLELPGRSAVHAPNAMASTSQPLSTTAALDILKRGGNAMDAAIAACAVQCVVEPQSTSLGGDCFCLYSPASSGDVVAFNGSVRTPAGLSLDYLLQKGLQLERTSPHAVIVPGAVDAWCQLHAQHGRLPFADLVQPAIGYALNGFPVAPRVIFDTLKQQELFDVSPSLSRIFQPKGVPMQAGDLLVQKALGKTLQKIADHGRDGFYSGEVAADMVDTLRALGGVHTLEDFANAKGEFVTPISSEYADHMVYECPPNGQGMIALLLLNIMKEMPVVDDPLSVDRIHLEIEACRLAYQARTQYLADPAQAQVPVEEILSQSYARKLAAQIDMKKAQEVFDVTCSEGAAHEDTVYITVVDEERNACSFINTLFFSYGGGITAEKSGVVLTNRGEGFVLDPSSPNCIAPNKRPLHTIIPAMLKHKGRTVMPFGVMGGEYQAMGHMQFLTRLLDYDQDVQQAQDMPRFMVSPFEQDVEIESTVDSAKVEALAKRGHRIAAADSPIGGSQAIHINYLDDGDEPGRSLLVGGSDPRKDGHAAGY